MDHKWFKIKTMKGGEGPAKESHSNLLEHLVSLYSGKPKAVSVCIVITSSTTVALDERCTSKLFQTGPRGCEGLARTFSTSTGVLQNKYDHVLAIPTRNRRGCHCSQGRARVLPSVLSARVLPSVLSASCSHHGTYSSPHCPQPASQSLLHSLGTAVSTRHSFRNQPTTPPTTGDDWSSFMRIYRNAVPTMSHFWNIETSSNLGPGTTV